MPDFVEMADCGQSAEEIIVEVSRIKNLLQLEITNFLQAKKVEAE
jgi:hypothetical protein